jgi:hypothetical protein
MFILVRMTLRMIKKEIKRMNQLRRAKVLLVTMAMMMSREVNLVMMKSLY